MAGRFDNRHVVVTGGAGALGEAVVRLLSGEGAICHVPAYSQEEAEAFGLADHKNVHVTAGLDLADEGTTEDYYADLPALWASLHIAGGFAMSPIAKTGLSDLEAQFRINVATCFLSCREAVKKMRAGGANGGRIVNVASRPALAPAPNMTAYSVAKAGVAALTRSLAEEVKGEGILVNAVAPSIIDTPANREAMPDADFDSWPKPAQIAEAIAFLAAPENALTSGAVVPVYGRA